MKNMMEQREYKVGGPVSKDGTYFYIERQADKDLLSLCRNHEYSYILASRQIGKSTLIFDVAAQLVELKGCHAAVIDLNTVGKDTTPLQKWFYSFIYKIAKQLKLEINVSEWWKSQTTESISYITILELFFDKVLNELPGSIFIFIDEIDSILGAPFSNDFFAAIRSFYTIRAQNPQFGRLAFILVGVATPDELIDDTKRTPFNIAHRIDLEDFDYTQVQELVNGLNLSAYKAKNLSKAIYDWTSGHPYLTQRLCAAIVREEVPFFFIRQFIEKSVKKEFLEFWQEDTHFAHVANDLKLRAPAQLAKKVLQTYRRIHRNWLIDRVRSEKGSKIHSYLKLSGIVKEKKQFLKVRNRIYKEVFSRKWVDLDLSLLQRFNSQSLASRLFTLSVIIFFIIVPALLITITTNQTQFAQSMQNAEATFEQSMQIEKATSDAGIRNAEATSDAGIRNAEATSDAGIRNAEATIERLEDDSLAISQTLTASNIALEQAKNTQDEAVATIEALETRIAETERVELELELAAASADQRFQALVIASQGTTIYETSKDSELALLLTLQASELSKMADGVVHPLIQDLLVSLLSKIEFFNSVLTVHQAGIRAIAYSPSGKMFASSDQQGHVFLWKMEDLNNPVLIYSVENDLSGDDITALQFSTDGKILAFASNAQERGVRELRLWNVNENQQLDSIQLEYGSFSIDFSADNELLGIASNNGDIYIWDWKNETRLTLLPQEHERPVYAIDFSPENQLLASADDGGTIIVWDLTNLNNPTHRILVDRDADVKHTDTIWDISFSHDGSKLASVGIDEYVILWDFNTQRTIGTRLLTDNRSALHSISFSSDDQWLAAGADDGTVKIWNLFEVADNPNSKATILNTGHSGDIRAIAYSPNNPEELITAGFSEDRTIRIWDLTEKDPLLNTQTSEIMPMHQLTDIVCGNTRRPLTDEEWFLEAPNYSLPNPSICVQESK